MLSMALLMLIVRDDDKLIPVDTVSDKVFLLLAVFMILINFVGWTVYYLGYQYLRIAYHKPPPSAFF